jgi:hypothetical protein
MLARLLDGSRDLRESLDVARESLQVLHVGRIRPLNVPFKGLLL